MKRTEKPGDIRKAPPMAPRRAPATGPRGMREAETHDKSHAEMKRFEQELLTLSHLSQFDGVQAQMAHGRIAQMMHKIGGIRLPYLRIAFQARTRRVIGRQQPRLHGRIAEERQQKTRRRAPKRRPQAGLFSL